jgi:outer membrane lipoprotein SlyB
MSLFPGFLHPMNTITSSSPASRPSRALLIGGGIGLVALGALATALVMRPSSPAATDIGSPATSTTVPVKKAENHARDSRSAPTPLDTQPAVAAVPACAICGVVEAVTPVQQKGEGTGIGAVAGGVVGGVVGHQVGGGTGKQAMTVIGAIGGGLAGHEIEKRARSTTSYQLKIRMADGSTRTVNQAQSLNVGQRVHVDGGKVTPAAEEGGATAPGGVRTLQTSARS